MAQDMLDVRSEVLDSLRAHRPFMALESTLIAHDLPRLDKNKPVDYAALVS